MLQWQGDIFQLAHDELTERLEEVDSAMSMKFPLRLLDIRFYG